MMGCQSMGCKMKHKVLSRRIAIFRSKEGAVGIGAMVVFIAMVLIAAIAASVLVQTAGQIENQAARTGEQTKNEISTGVFVLDIAGRVVNNKVENLTVTIRLRPGSNDINLNNVALELSDGSKKVLLTMNTSASWNFNTTVDSDGQVFGTGAWNETANQFGVIVLEDRDGSVTFTSPVMNSGDLVMLCVSCTACFNGIDGNDEVLGKILPEEGSSGVFGFEVPASLRDTVVDLF
jgi:flagellin FlaB